MDIVTARDIRAALMKIGFSCRSWALAHGYTPRTVQKCINTHAPEYETKIKGKEYRLIMQDLSLTLGVNLNTGANDE